MKTRRVGAVNSGTRVSRSVWSACSLLPLSNRASRTKTPTAPQPLLEIPNQHPVPARSRATGFTLLELLVVMAIIGLLAGLAVPVLNNFRPNYTASATAQLLDALSRARQLAISERTTVYMVFVPTNYWTDPGYGAVLGNPSERAKGQKLLDKQMIGYNFVSLRSLGDQPGRPTVRYLDIWRTLPEGAFIYPGKFAIDNPVAPLLLYTNLPGQPSAFVRVYGFDRINTVPFPSEDAPKTSPARPYATLPFIGFDYLGRVISGKDEIIPLSKGSVGFARGPDRKPLQALPSMNEQPPGNATNNISYNLIYVDWLTGRARAIHQEVR